VIAHKSSDKRFHQASSVCTSKVGKKEGNYLSYASKIVVMSNHYKDSSPQKYSFLNSSDIVAFPNVIDFKRFESFKTSP